MIPYRVRQAFLAETSHIIRRVEIYEQDSETPFEPTLWPKILVDGTVSLDNSDEERRTVDLTLLNPDSRLDPTIGKLWYDKIIKIFYGVQLQQREGLPKVAVVHDSTEGAEASNLALILSGFCSVTHLPMTSSLADVDSYDVLAFISTDSIRKRELLNRALSAGIPAIVFSPAPNPGDVPLLVGNVGGTLTTYTNATLTPVEEANNWDPFVISSHKAKPIISIAAGARTVITHTGGPGAVVREAEQGQARSALVQMANFDLSVFATEADYANCAVALGELISWLRGDADASTWEIQLGEFLIDSASASSESGGVVEVTGRDRVKQCKNSKLEQAVTYTKGKPIEDVIDTMAANSWVTKRNLPRTGDTLDRDMTWEADTTRWEIMRDLATSFNYDLFFDNTGTLVMSKFQDPLSSPAVLDLSVGEHGNLVSRGLRTSDSELFNHIVVIGEGADSDSPPVWASAINEDRRSPSNVYELGDRVNRYTSSTITTRAQAQELANSMLSVASLEEFELDFSTPLLPWVEPGQIVYLTDDAAGTWGPNRFLISSLSFPLDLTPMSGTGKRVINVG